MKCIALATHFGQKKTNWHIPSSNYSPSAFFTTRSLKKFEEDLRTQIIDLFEILQSGESIRFIEDMYFIHIQKLDNDCCAILCDTELTPQQMNYLSIALLSQQIPLKVIADNIEQYMQDYKTLALKADVEEVLNTMKHNMEKTLQRDIKIDDLVDKADKLEKHSIQFQRTVHEKTSSCWPSACNLL
ncbi:MAG: hypothetical protein A3F46_02505 [Legionellales bacterium RIFCSPHIGHO2_12_FULL_42_9]|nr:MAG: hypothetical protein A3F46_02505 [Legionellales bacterium RIFCSPHIGHO2_12_FULL_42_9]